MRYYKKIYVDKLHSREVFFTESPSAKFISGGDSVKDKNQTQPKGITKRPCKDQIFLQSIMKDKTD